MSPETPNSVEVFYSYAHEDEKLRDELVKHLANLRRQGVITEWYDRDIAAGKEWEGEIKQHLDSARVILLLISPDFMNSDYIHDVEVKRAMERHEAGEARVIPVVLRPVDWQGAPFSKLHSLPSDVRPVTLWKNQDEAFLDVTTGIRVAIQELSDPTVSISASLDIPGPPKVGFVSRRDRDNRDIVEQLHKELAPQINQLVVLWGAGGVGKTAIAAEAVRGLIGPFAGRVAWVSADGLGTFSLTTLLDGITTQLGHPDLRKLPPDLKREQVHNLVKTAPTLVVLDNFETIEAAERAHCVEWLGKPAPCTALITTRDIIEEVRSVPIEAMRPEEANDLLDKLIAQTHEARPFARLDRARLIETAEANPLVLQWIIGQIDLAQDPDELLDELGHGEGTAAERVFKRSFELRQLDNGGRAVLLALSLFAPSGTRKAVAQVSGFGKETDKRKFRDAVKSLSSLWLIHTVDESKRLAVEGLTRQFTKARLETDPRGKSFRARFVSRFLSYAQTHKEPTPEHYDALEQEKDNLLTAMDVAFETKQWDDVMRLLRALAFPGMLDTRGYWDEVITKGKQAATAAQLAGNQAAVAEFEANTAVVRRDRGEYDEALVASQNALTLFRALNDENNVAASLHQLGRLAFENGDLQNAKRLYSESLVISRHLNHEEAVAGALHELGRVAQEDGERDEARCLYDDGLSINRRIGNERGIAAALHQLGSLAYLQDDVVEATSLYRQSLKISQQLGSQKEISNSLHNLAIIAQDEGDPREAERLYDQALAIRKKLGDQRGVVATLRGSGRLAEKQGKLEQAREFYNNSLGLAKRIRNEGEIAITQHCLARLAEDEGNRAEATGLFREALMIFEKLDSPYAKATRDGLARVEGESS